MPAKRINFIRFVHHNPDRPVVAREDLKGAHRSLCLCHQCTKLNVTGKNNCPIAKEHFAWCIKNDTAAPVLECPEFIPKVPANIYEQD
jgi:hypothetical protein